MMRSKRSRAPTGRPFSLVLILPPPIGELPPPIGESTQSGERQNASLRLGILLLSQLQKMLRHFHHAISVLAKRQPLCDLYAQCGVAAELYCLLLRIRHDQNTDVPPCRESKRRKTSYHAFTHGSAPKRSHDSM